MFTRLLVGLDGSAGAEAALTAAIGLARRFGSTLVLATVTDVRLLEAPVLDAADPLWTGALPAAPVAAQLGEVLSERADRLLGAGAERAKAEGLAVETARAVGLVEEELLRLSEQAEAIVVGRRGEVHGQPGELGGTTARIIRKSPKPVMVAGERPSACAKPVVAYDGGETSSKALALAARYAGAAQVPLIVVHVGEAKESDALLAKAGAYLSAQGVAFETHRLTGPVASAVSELIAKSGADLLVAGAHGGKKRAWALGSHAEKLLRATTVPVIINR